MKFLCDFDSDVPREFATRLGVVARIVGLTVEWVRYDRTRRGWHVIVNVREQMRNPVMVVLVQALLGSDWKREAFNARRVRHGKRVPAFWRDRLNVLYHFHFRGIVL